MKLTTTSYNLLFGLSGIQTLCPKIGYTLGAEQPESSPSYSSSKILIANSINNDDNEPLNS